MISSALLPDTSRWHALADSVLDGTQVTREQALEILRSGDEELLGLISAAFRLRERTFGKTVQLYFLMNAKSGLCPEDCNYCSQSKSRMRRSLNTPSLAAINFSTAHVSQPSDNRKPTVSSSAGVNPMSEK